MGLLFSWHISDKVWVSLDTQAMEVTIQQGFEGEKVVLEAHEWFKMMMSIDRELMKQRTKVAHMVIQAGSRFVTTKPHHGFWKWALCWRR